MVIKFIFIILFVFSQNAELFEEYYKEAEKYMSNMTLEQKIGQLFFPRFNDTTKESDINNKYPGGYVLFAYDFENKKEEDVINNIEYIQKLSKKATNLPLGLSVDEEGGKVNRISPTFRKEGGFPSPQQIYNESGIEGVLKIDKEKRDLLRKFKMNINLAPVADISYNSNDYIYYRTLGKGPEETADYIKKDVESYEKDNFSCCNKHFPGYGNNIDTHGDIAIDNRPYEIFQKEDFKAFEAGISENIPMILVSHNIVTCKDDKYPASLSKEWHNILRNELKFSGLILTDDLSMNAIKKYSGDLSPAILAVNAGNDILLTSQYYEHLDAVKEAVYNKTISEETINLACKRIIAWKIKYLMNNEEKEKEKEQEQEQEQKQEQEQENKNEGNDHTALIICLTIVGIIVIGIIFYFISKFFLCKNKSDEDIEKLIVNQ